MYPVEMLRPRGGPCQLREDTCWHAMEVVLQLLNLEGEGHITVEMGIFWGEDGMGGGEAN